MRAINGREFVGIARAGGDMTKRLHRQQKHDSVDWIQVMLTIDRPAPERLAGCDRKEKFDILLENAQHKRTQLMQWIQEHGLTNEVGRIGTPTSFNLLFVQCTPHAADQLAYAPGVVDIALEYE
jgi:hypothetical protein